MLLTILEARITPGHEGALQAAYAAAASEPVPAGLVSSELLRDSRDPARWHIQTLWESREALEAMRAAGTPTGVLMFRAAGAEPVLSVHEVVDAIPRVHPWVKPPIAALETERLVLEPITRAHAAELFPLFSDARVYEFMPQDPPPSLAAMESMFERFERRLSPDGRQLWLDWAVRRKERGVCVGRVEATLNPDQSADLAYTFGVEHWGRGFGTEAVRRTVESLFQDFGAGRIVAEVHTGNVASIRILERLGFSRDGAKPDARYIPYSLRRPPAG